MEVIITIRAEVSDPETLEDLVDIIQKVTPYIADNVIVTSEEVER